MGACARNPAAPTAPPGAASSPSRPGAADRRGRARLADEVEVAVLAAGVGPDGEDLDRVHRQRLGGAVELRLLVGVAAALPGDEDAAGAEERGGELGEGAEAADGAGGDGVVGLAALAAGPVLGAGVDHPGVGDPAGAAARSMNSHLRPIDSTRSTRASGSTPRGRGRGSRRPRRRRRSSRRRPARRGRGR